MNKYVLTSSVFLCSALLFSGCGADSKTSATPAAKVASKPAAVENVNLKEATQQYRKFAIEQCDLFVKSTGEFVAAVKAGDIAKSKELYAPTRMYYERIEPIAEALGDLDPNIDAREGDVEEKDWRG